MLLGDRKETGCNRRTGTASPRVLRRQVSANRELNDAAISPMSGIDDDDGVELASNLSRRKNARKIFIPRTISVLSK